MYSIYRDVWEALDGAFTSTGVNTSFSGGAGVHCVAGKHKHGLSAFMFSAVLSVSSRSVPGTGIKEFSGQWDCFRCRLVLHSNF